MSSTLRRIGALLTVLVLALVVSACGGDDGGGGGNAGTANQQDEQPGTAPGGGGGDPAQPTGGGGTVAAIERVQGAENTSVTVGSKNFTEQFILGEIYAQALEAAGYRVKKELNLGSEQIAYRALRRGQVDAYPEYTGTALTSFFDVDVEDVPRDPDQAYTQAQAAWAEEGITALGRTEFDNTYILASTREAQQQLLNGATTISEVSALPKASELRLAGFPECRQRTDCLVGLQEIYDFDPEFVSTEAKYEPLDNDESDIALVFATDGELALDRYAVYEDDKQLFPPYNITLAVRDEKMEELGPEGREILERVQRPLNAEVMRELNSRVDLDKQEPEAVAQQYLREIGAVGGAG